MPKIIQIATSVTESNGENLYALCVDNSIWKWGRKISGISVSNPNMHEYKFGWIKLIDELNK